MNISTVKEKAGRYSYLLTSLLLFLSFPSYDHILFKGFPLFAWFALIPLFRGMEQVRGRDVYFIAFGAGFFGNLLAYNWIGHFGASVKYGPYVVLLFLIPFLTFFFALKAWTAEMLSRVYPRMRPLIFGAVWIAGDFLQSIGHLAFPWPRLGYSQYTFTPMVQLASITGVSGVTFLMAATSSAAAAFINDGGIARIRNRLTGTLPGRQLLVCIAVVAVVISWGTWRLAAAPSAEKNDLTVAMVQSCIDPWKSWYQNREKYLEELKFHTDSLLARNPDLVIWSESATLENISHDFSRGMTSDYQKKIFDYVTEINRPLVTGEIGVTVASSGDGRMRRKPLNNAVLIEPGYRIGEYYSKIHLVPFGEWFPYNRWLPAIQKLLDSFQASSFVPGTEPRLFSVQDRAFGPLVCYEGIFQHLSRTYRAMGADFLVNITNDGWTDTYSGHMQHFSSSVFRAVENGCWFVRAGNTGYTVIVDPLGRVTASFPILKKGGTAGSLDFSLNRQTVYTGTGDVMTSVSIFSLFLLGGAAFHRRFKKSRER